MAALLSPKNDTAMQLNLVLIYISGKMYFLEDYVCLLHFKNTFTNQHIFGIYIFCFLTVEFFQSTNHIRRPGLITKKKERKASDAFNRFGT